MLRLSPTCISLEPRDLVWHEERHQRRQAERKRVNNAAAIIASSELSPRTRKTRQFGLTIRPAPPSVQEDIPNGLPILSPQPVPQGSRAFWDQVLADAGTPTRTQTIGSQNARIIKPSEDFFGSNRSSRASLADSDSDSLFDLDQGNLLPGAQSSSVVRRKDLNKHYGTSFESLHSVRRNEAGEIDSEAHDPDQARRSPIRERIVAIFRRQNKQIDGPSDRRGPLPSPADSSTDEAPDDRQICSANWVAHVEEELPMEGNLGRPAMSVDNAAGKTPILPYGVARVSPGLGLLSQPPRRRQRAYRRRSRSYSYIVSEDSQTFSLPQYDGLGASPPTVDNHFSPVQSVGLVGNIGHSPNSGSQDRPTIAHSPFTPDQFTPSRPVSSRAPSQASLPAYVSLANGDSLRVSSYLSLHSGSGQSVHSTQMHSPLSQTPLISPSNQHSSRHSSLSLPPPFSATCRNVSIHEALPTVNPPQPSVEGRQSAQHGLRAPQYTAVNDPAPPLLRSQTSTHVAPLSIEIGQLRISIDQTDTSRTSSLDPLALPFSPRAPSPNPSSTNDTNLASSANIQLPPTQAPSTPIPRSSHPKYHRTPSLAVYNDALPPSTQPQTLADLSRRSTRLATSNPFSAPPRSNRSTSWTRPAAFVRAPPTTPTRDTRAMREWIGYASYYERLDRGERDAVGMIGEERDGSRDGGMISGDRVGGSISRSRTAGQDLENEGRVTPEERAWRRRRDLAMGMGREEIERTRGGL